MDIFQRINDYATAKKISFEEAALAMIGEGRLHPRELQMLPEGTVDDGFHSQANEAYETYQIDEDRRAWLEQEPLTFSGL